MANPVQGNQSRFPERATEFVDDDGIIATPWYLLLNSLFDRTGGGQGLWTMPSAQVNAAGATQGTATVLSRNVNYVTSAGGGVALPSCMQDQIIVVFNITPSVALKVYPNASPPGNAQINNLGANAAYVMNPGGAIAAVTFQMFFFASSTQIYAIKLG